MPPVRRRIPTIAAVALGAMPLAAQTPPAATPPATIPGLEKFSLPGSPTATPTPAPSPTPLPRPTPTATPTPSAPARQPTVPAATPSPRAAPRPQTTPTPVASPTPVPPPNSEIAPAPSGEVVLATPAPELPADAPPIDASPAPARPTDGEPWRYLGWLAALALAGFLVWLALSRRTRRRPAVKALPKPATPDPAPPPASPASPVPRARLAIDLRPTRAGLNLLSATVDCEVRVTNTGDAPAEAVRLAVRLFSAHADQDADLAAFRAQPIVRPAAPPFALAPGETRSLRAVAALPHADIRPLNAGGRPMFVPVVAVNALYRAGEGRDGQTTRSFSVGIERVDSPKLAPFWLDQPPRTVTAVAARAHGAAVETN